MTKSKIPSEFSYARVVRRAALLGLCMAALVSCVTGVDMPDDNLTPIPVIEDPGNQVAADATRTTATEPSLENTPLPQLPPGDLKLWPLPADVYFLDDVGQVWRQPRLGNESTQVVISPAGLAVEDFAIAPGGDWLAYRTAAAIVVADRTGKNVTSIADIEAFTIPDNSANYSLAWSKDAGRIAFLTSSGFTLFQPGEGTNGDPALYTVTDPQLKAISWSPGSGWILVTRINATAALYRADTLAKWVELGVLNDHVWLSDGRLAFAPAEGGLALLTPGDVNSRTFLLPQDRFVSNLAPRLDGTLAFIVQSAAEDKTGYPHTANVDNRSFRIVSGYPVEVLGSTWDPTGLYLSMLPNSREMVISDPQTSAAASISLTFPAKRLQWGDIPPEMVDGINLPSDLFFLAPQAGVDQVWRLPANGAAPQLLTNSPDTVEGFSLAPGRTQLVYSAGDGLWRSVINTLDISQVASLFSGREVSAAPVFSPSGMQIAYANRGIWILDLNNGESQQIAADQQNPVRIYSNPIWSPDGEWLLAKVYFSEGEDLVLLPLPDRPGRTATYLNRFGASAAWVDDVTFFAYTSGAKYGSPYIDLFQTASPPVSSRLYNLPIIGAEPRLDGRVVLLKTPVPGTGGPTIIEVMSVLPDGTDLRREAGVFALEQAVISPDAGFIAGLIHTVSTVDDTVVGQLVIVDISSGKPSLIKGVSGVHNLVWGR